MLGRIDRLGQIAADAGLTMPQLALGWILQHEGVSVAIPGAKRVEHLRDNAAAGDPGGLPDEVFAAVEKAAGR
jgi:aryl-alcohol dehydrogenase-like predicted oxidoreductase